ncbi:hypothetical protein [Alkalicoccus urumqiensis]|uniref:Uncharacterized protein n=1 Tax=Alkalicoccus urumqiensis TaxID=1548213 RepID=A0A2P6ME54_ALKUR|nr:hypothetical protein [Alkalicoccus urumqiensis]PRO64557.1 hypothetical protein C6I21_13745 [Alkalicoccus urumqiensis]
MNTSYITKEKLEEVAERYGLELKEKGDPGFYIENQKINLESLFSDVLNPINFKVIDNLNVEVDKKLKKIDERSFNEQFEISEIIGAA